jgi:hypothetical protein
VVPNPLAELLLEVELVELVALALVAAAFACAVLATGLSASKTDGIV